MTIDHMIINNKQQTNVKNKKLINHKPEVGRDKTGQGGLLHLLGDQNAGLGGEVWRKYLLMLTQRIH